MGLNSMISKLPYPVVLLALRGGGDVLFQAPTQQGGALTVPEMRQRLAAILAADVAGYSRLMAADERATVAALDAARGVFRKLIDANQGRVIDMAGDSVLAVFETAGGALRAAMAI